MGRTISNGASPARNAASLTESGPVPSVDEKFYSILRTGLGTVAQVKDRPESRSRRLPRVTAGRKPKRKAMYKLNKLQTLQLIANVCQRYGCEIRKVDLDRHILDIEGPVDAQERCRQELEVYLD